MAEGGGLLNRYRCKTPIVGSNPIPSATFPLFAFRYHMVTRRAPGIASTGVVEIRPRETGVRPKRRLWPEKGFETGSKLYYHREYVEVSFVQCL